MYFPNFISSATPLHAKKAESGESFEGKRNFSKGQKNKAQKYLGRLLQQFLDHSISGQRAQKRTNTCSPASFLALPEHTEREMQKDCIKYVAVKVDSGC